MNLQEKRAMLDRLECERTDAEFGIKIAEIQKGIDRLNRWIDYPMKRLIQDVRSSMSEAAQLCFKK